MYKRIFFAVGFSLTLFYPISCLAYKPEMHQAFTFWASRNSQIEQRILDLGSEFSSSSLAYKKLKPLHRTPPIDTDFEDATGIYRDVLMFGALWEDDKPTSAAQARPLNHFFDPQNNRALTVEAPFLIGGEYPVIPPGLIGMQSPDWILEDIGDVNPNFAVVPYLPFGAQDFSYFDARRYFLMSLTAPSIATRHENIQKMYQSLGHVLHHIQDMGQPQHVRNDLHCDACEKFHVNFNDESQYEILTGSRGNIDRIIDKGFLNKDVYPFSTSPVVLDLPRQYWISGTSSKWGMAEHTSENFITTESGYLSKTYVSPSPSYAIQNASQNAKYPKPSAQGLTVSTPIKLRDLIGQTILPIDDKDLLEEIVGDATVYFVGKTITDPYPGRAAYDLHNPRHATLGFFSYSTGSPSDTLLHKGVFTENHFNYESKVKFLFPRITAFSSGLLDYFFRGSIELFQNNGQWFIRNTTALGNDRTMEGTFLIYSQNQAGERVQVSSQQLLLSSGSISPAFSLTVPPGNVALIAVFSGRLGQEGNGNRLFAVAGDYVSHVTPPPVQCNTPLSPAGGVGTWNFPISLGGTKGDVDLDFETYTVPDSLRITLDDGRELYSTNGLVSGYRRHTVSFDPNGRADVIATARISAPTNGTAWTFRLGCPGVPLSDDRISVTFYWGPTSGAQCRVRLKVDGTTNTSSTLSTSHQFTMKLKPGTHSYDVVNYDCTRVDLGADFTFRVKVGSTTTTLKSLYGGAWTGNIPVGNAPSIPGATNW